VTSLLLSIVKGTIIKLLAWTVAAVLTQVMLCMQDWLQVGRRNHVPSSFTFQQTWNTLVVVQVFAFSAFTLLVGRWEEHLTCKKWVMGCWCGYLPGLRCRLFAYGPADATAFQNPIVSSHLIQSGFYRTTLVQYMLWSCVCLSVTSWCSTKTAKLRSKQTTPLDSPETLAFWRQKSPRNSTSVNPCGGAKCRWGWLKSATFDK